jgi:hypothetical protein
VSLYLPPGTYYLQINPKNIEWVEFYLSLIPELTVLSHSVINQKKDEITLVIPRNGVYELSLSADTKITNIALYRRGIIDAKYNIMNIMPDQFTYQATTGLAAGVYKLVTSYKNEATGNIKVIAKPDTSCELEPNNNILSFNPLSYENVNGALYSDDIDYFALKLKGDINVKLNLTDLISGDKVEFKLYTPTGTLIKSVPYYADANDGDLTFDLNLSDGVYPFSLELIRSENNTSPVFYDLEFDGNYVTGINSGDTLELSTPFLAQITSGNVLIYEGNDQVKEETIGNAIIVAGVSDDPGDPLFGSFQKLTEKAYQTFLFRGFTDQNLYYINAVKEHDLDADGIDDAIVDNATLSMDTLLAAIKQAENENTSQPLYIFIASHGGIGSLKIGQDFILMATELEQAIADFVQKTGRKVFIILEACHSGSFKYYLDDLDKVTLIYSSDFNELSFLDPETGASFTYFWLQNILTGHTIEESIQNAKEHLQGIKPPQMNQSPGYVAFDQTVLDTLVGMRLATASIDTLKITDYYGQDGQQIDLSQDSKEIQLYLKIASGTAIEKLGVYILPPTITLNTEDYDTPDFSPYYTDLVFNGDVTNPAYVTKYSLKYNGEYKLIYVVKDVDGNIVSATGTIDVQGGEDYGMTEVTLTLVKGWNLLNIPVQPENSGTQALFSGLAYISAWKWENNNWAVLLNDADTQAYAASKGFGILTTLNAGEGFWLNMEEESTLNVIGTEVSNSNLSFVQGWNLVGLKVNEEKSIEDVVPDSAISAWKWENNNWAVWLPDQETLQEYAASKGFAILQNIKPDEGFWVNVK